MADRDLREKDREAGLGDFEAELRALQERVRVGEVSNERLALATALGHRAAALLSGHDCEESMSPCLRCWPGFQPIERACDLGGSEAVLRIVIAASRCCFGALEKVGESKSWDKVSRFVWRGWGDLETPRLRSSGSWEEDWGNLSRLIAEAIRIAEAHVLGGHPPKESTVSAELKYLSQRGRFNLEWAMLPLSVIDSAACPNWLCLRGVAEEETLFREIAREVVPWALGLSDPLR